MSFSQVVGGNLLVVFHTLVPLSLHSDLSLPSSSEQQLSRLDERVSRCPEVFRVLASLQERLSQTIHLQRVSEEHQSSLK